MKLILTFILLIHFSNLFAFTLNNNVNLAFKKEKINVNLASGFCTNIGISDDEFLSIIEDAVSDYWNKVPTAKIKLLKGSKKSVSANFQTGLICNSGTNCDPNPALEVDSDILISCNNNATNFPSSSILGVTVPNHSEGSTLLGSLIIINDRADTQFDTKSRDEKVAIIAHEIGHALGLGHSPVKDSLMYYSTVPNRRSLGRDDIDGITYLYPKQQPISCGTVITENSTPQWPSLFIGFVLIYLVYLKLRPRLAHSRS